VGHVTNGNDNIDLTMTGNTKHMPVIQY